MIIKRLYIKSSYLLSFAFSILVLISCEEKATSRQETKVSTAENQVAFEALLTKHLNAVTNKDTTALRATLSPKGNMELIQPKAEILNTANSFMEWHAAWFKTPNWTFETKIISMDVSEHLGVATTEIIYREPERNGKPYFNRMSVSYTLEKTAGKWYVIKDHASSIERSTD